MELMIADESMRGWTKNDSGKWMYYKTETQVCNHLSGGRALHSAEING